MMDRILISGTGSGVGKTMISSAVMYRMSKESSVQGYKVGPDFIDPMYHRMVTGRTSRNLDGFMMGADPIKGSFVRNSRDAGISIIEGVRGLYEGIDPMNDVGSSAEIAKLLRVPVVLVVDSRSLTRSAAAIVKGFMEFDRDVTIAAVILNNISGSSHRNKAVKAIEEYTGLPVVGTVPRGVVSGVRSRHLGLNTVHEGQDNSAVLDDLNAVADFIDMDALRGIAAEAPEIEDAHPVMNADPERYRNLRVAVPFDEAFCFYYPENTETLQDLGAKIIRYSPLAGDGLPDADVHYLGGGYPEMHCRPISENGDFLEGLRSASADGRTILAECGGLMALCESIMDLEGERYPMAGALPADAEMTLARQGLSYTIAEPTEYNPVFSKRVMKGHEFHYSRLSVRDGAKFGFDVLRGKGISGNRDGLTVGRTIGSYMHMHALSDPRWAEEVAASGWR